MIPLREVVLKLGATLALIPLLVGMQRGLPWLTRHAHRVFVGLVMLGGLAYVNFGTFHQGTFAHDWDQLHYVLGSKYYPELGYDGLYVAMLSARSEVDPGSSWPEPMRDLRTAKVVSPEQLQEHAREVRARFRGSRWKEFVQDATSVWIREDFYRDHGYLPTPAHTAVSRLFSSWLPFNYRTMRLFAAVDFLLLAVGALLLARWVGLETLAAVSLIFGLGFCNRYFWAGGAFLRQDWLVALLVAGAALHRRRFALAGAALGYASAVRLFPALCLLPLTAHMVADFRRRREAKDALRLLVSLCATGASLFVAGGLQGRGLTGWLEFARRAAIHARGALPNSIGLRVPFVTSVANLRGELLDPRSFYLFERASEDYADLYRARLFWISLLGIVLSAWAVRVAYRARDGAHALAAGVVLIFCFTAPSCYYGSFFALLAFHRPLRTCTAFLIATVGTWLIAACVYWLSLRGLIVLGPAPVFTAISVVLGALLVDWLWSFRDSEAEQRRGTI